VLKERGRSEKLGEAEVYIHVKGYSLARVTHLDIEHPKLNKHIPPRGGRFMPVLGVRGGLKVVVSKDVRVEVYSPLLNKVMPPGSRTFTWVGGKYGGAYIGFKREEVRKLEEIAKEVFGVEPRRPRFP